MNVAASVVTKTYRRAMCREIIDRNCLLVDFSDDDVREFVKMAGWDGEGITAIQRRKNPKFPSDTRHLHVCIDGEWQSKSWVKSIAPPAKYAEEKSVMRKAITTDTQEYLYGCGIDCCEHCGSDQNLQVDHSDPAFDEIAIGFFNVVGVPSIIPCQSGVGYVFKDIDAEAAWIAFHTANANYQILCRSCNASKGNGKSVKREATK